VDCIAQTLVVVNNQNSCWDHRMQCTALLGRNAPVQATNSRNTPVFTGLLHVSDRPHRASAGRFKTTRPGSYTQCSRGNPCW
jgi:hypothetical protein